MASWPLAKILNKIRNVTGFLKNNLQRQKKANLKKKEMKDELFDVARTRKCAECGSDDEIMLLTLHPSLWSHSWLITLYDDVADIIMIL